jgi:hypothetical protein
MALIANTNRNPKRRARPYSSADFLPRWARPEPQSPAQMIATAKAIARAGGGTVVEGGSAWRTSQIS